MKKYRIEKLDINIYKHVCKNGLEIYLVPNKTVHTFFATLNIRYGSNILKYKIGDEIIELPKGIAHFLEHKVFEQEDGENPFDFFSSRGADCNASTTNSKTNYIFSGSTNYDDCLNYLLDYVQKPYFTDENVLKEKDIIKQEILMYEDDPYQVLYSKSFMNTYKKDFIRYKISGEVKDIMSITKEQLNDAYETFYQPKNMFLIVTGNIKVNETIKIVENNQAKKTFKEPKFEIINLKEPLEVNKKQEEVYDDVGIPKIAINIKFPINDLRESIPGWQKYLTFFLDNVVGNTSVLKERLFNKHLLSSDISYEVIKTVDYCSLLIMFEAEAHEEVIKEVLQELKEYRLNKNDFDLNKKMLKSTYIYMSDNIYSINSFVANQLMEYMQINEKCYLDVDNMNEKEYNDVMSNVDFNNYSVVILKSKLAKK